MAPDEFPNAARRVAAATFEHFKACLAHVPEPANSELLRLSGQLAAAENMPVAPKVVMLLAYDLGIRDERSFVRINNASALGALHSQMLDDIVDNKGIGARAAIRNAYLAHLVFDFYYEAWAKIREQPPTFAEMSEFMEVEVETYSALFEEEVRHVGVSFPFTSQRAVANKAAPIKAVVLQMLRLTGREDLQNVIFRAIEDCSFALLLVDDLVDWEQDFDLQRFTYPIQAALDRLNLIYSPDHHESLKQKVARALFFGTLYHELLKDIIEKFTTRANDLDAQCPMFAGWLREYLASTVRVWREHSRWLFAKAAATDEKKLTAAT